MPVNYATPAANQLFPVPGVRLGVAEAEIRKKNRRDLTLVALDAGCTVAGVFTQNRFCAAPVQICRKHLAGGKEIRALIINTGIANAGTGEPGRLAAQASCEAVAALLGVDAQQVLPFSTGVILELLPVERIKAGLPAVKADLKADNWYAAAHAIMTTDTVAKAASRIVAVNGKKVTISGVSKGAGMIKPNMATMLGFLATDAGIAQSLLDKLVKDAADASFNCITVDGDTSTNDSYVMIASGQSGAAFTAETDTGWAEVKAAIIAVSVELAQAIVRDGEGATKFITVAVEGGKDIEECRKVGYAIGHSPLSKHLFLPPIPILVEFLRRLAMQGSMTWMLMASRSGWMTCWSPKMVAGRQPTGKRMVRASWLRPKSRCVSHLGVVPRRLMFTPATSLTTT